MREQILDQQAEDGKQHDVMVAGHQERERRRERLNSETAECQPNQTSRSRLDCASWGGANGWAADAVSAFASCGHGAAWTWTEMGHNPPPALQKNFEFTPRQRVLF
jgi:hypothetical protein